jgi:nickel/cobalt transporter (NiCoT) family protein
MELRSQRLVQSTQRSIVTNVRRRVVLMFVLLGVANAAAWVWAAIAFRHYPVLLGTAMLAYGLGLRHAIDADHIAAIDNVTRKLMADGARPIGVGLFFSLGHSTIVIAASIAIAATASMLAGPLAAFRQVGSTIGTIVSASFLIVIAVMNLCILASVYRAFHRAQAGGPPADEDLDVLLAGGGLLARLFRPLFRMVRRSWHMYPVGLLFGLGFDTATEIGLLGISAVEASKGLSFWSILVFPALFTAGMALVDSADSVLMVGAYGWAARSPVRKLYYNMTITFVSVVAALVVGGVEALGLVASRLGLSGGLWNGVAALNENFGNIGYLIIGVFVVSWLVSAVVYRLKGYHQLDAA